MTQLKYLLITLALLFSAAAFSQDGESVTVRDLESWNSLNLNYKISKKWEIGLEQQFRLSDNSTKMDDYITELTTKLGFGKYLYGGLGFRFARQLDDVGAVQGFENHVRFNFDFGAKHDIQRFNMKYRLRFQTKNELGVSKDEGDYANNHLRLKVGAKYNIRKWKLDPEISSEIFHHYEKGEENGFDNIRFTIGTQYKTKSYGKIGLYYRVEKELNAVYPKTTNIIRFKYTYTFKNRSK